MTFDSDNDNDEKKEETPVRRRRRPAWRRVPAQIQDGQMDASSEDVTPELQEIPSTMPLLPLRDVVVFNYMIVPLFVGREQSVHCLLYTSPSPRD